jgi:hypothetical protein
VLRESRARSWKRRATVAGTASVLATALIAAPAGADTYDNDGFESFPLGTPVTFLPGPASDPSSWSAFDPNGWNEAAFDIAIVDPGSGPWGSTFGSRALRISNGVTSGGFNNQLQSPSLADEAGETAASNMHFKPDLTPDFPMSGGTRQSRFSGSFTFASATQVYQPGLAVGISADKGDGTRMAHFVITDTASGLEVTYWYSTSPSAYAFEVIATGLSRDEPHTIEFSLDLVDGSNNDVMWIRLGDSVCNTWVESGSWENTHTVPVGTPPAHAPGTWTVDSLLFRVGGAAAPANFGGGLLFDDVTYTSSTVPPMPPVGTPGAPEEPDVQMNGATTTVVVPPVATNGCVPVTEYRVTLTPIPGGTPITYTSPTPTITFPTPGVGNWDVTVAATNTEGTGPESLPGALTVVLGETDDELANSGPTEATWPLAGLATALAALGIGLVFAGRPRRARA